MHRRSLAVLVLVPALALLAYSQATRRNMTTLYSNDFESGTNGASVSGWVGTNLFSSANGNFLCTTTSPIFGSKSYAMTGAGTISAMLQTGISAVADMDVVVAWRHRYTAGTPDQYGNVDPVARANSSGTSGYCAVIAANHADVAGGILYITKFDSGFATISTTVNVVTAFGRKLEDGDIVWTRIQAQGTTLRAKWWLDGTSEPGSWTTTATDSTYTSAGYGGFAASSTIASSNVMTADNFSIADFASGLTAGTLSNTALGGKSASFSIATNAGGTAPYSSQLQRSPSGAGTWTNVGTVATGTTATFTDFTPAAATAYDYRVVVTDNASATANSNTVTVTTIGFVAATDTKIACYGRSAVVGSNHVSVTNGAAWELSYTGQVGKLTFDTSTAVNFPAIAYWLDGVGPTRATLDYTGLVTLSPTYNTAPSGTVTSSGLATPPRSNVHTVRLVANIESEYPSTFDNWGTQRDALKFMGIAITSGEAALQVPTNPNQIEFLGDSITAGLRLLFTTTSGDGVAVDAPEINWPRQAADILGMKPVVNGHGGQGITTTGTDGTPIANSAFPYVYGTTAYAPTYKPAVVVIYQGTNDSAITQAQYQTFLTTIRAAYPSAYIFAVVPFQVTSTRRTNILAAVTAQADSRVFSLDYSAAFTVNTDTSDATHFNPGGAVRMASQLATDIQTQLNTSAVKMQGASGLTHPVRFRKGTP